MAKRGRRAKSILNTGDIDTAIDTIHGVSPTDKKVLRDFVDTNGSYNGVVKRTGLTRKAIYNIVHKPINRKAIRKAFRKLGIDLLTTVRVVKHVMLQRGDYHYDFNRLKAIELYAKLTGAFAPRKILLQGHLDTTNRHMVHKTILKLVRILHEGKQETLISDRKGT